jgi:hypothetical protein
MPGCQRQFARRCWESQGRTSGPWHHVIIGDAGVNRITAGCRQRGWREGVVGDRQIARVGKDGLEIVCLLDVALDRLVHLLSGGGRLVSPGRQGPAGRRAPRVPPHGSPAVGPEPIGRYTDVSSTVLQPVKQLLARRPETALSPVLADTALLRNALQKRSGFQAVSGRSCRFLEPAELRGELIERFPGAAAPGA